VIAAWAIDWLSVFLLGGLTLLDGLRRIPPGAHVLRRVGTGAWTAVTPEEGTRRLLVSWWTPFILRIVACSAEAQRGDDVRRLAERWRRMQRPVEALRLLGGMVLLGIVLGVPVAAETSGWRALLLVLLIVETLAIAVAIVALLALRRLGLNTRSALRAAGGLLSPFAAPRAAEIVLERAFAGALPVVVTRLLLPPSAFAAWIRPRAYDLLRGHAPVDDPELGAALSRGELQQIVRAPPRDRLTGEPWCARCGRVYRESTRSCAECDALSLSA
jgi:hypothetical protein